MFRFSFSLIAVGVMVLMMPSASFANYAVDMNGGSTHVTVTGTSFNSSASSGSAINLPSGISFSGTFNTGAFNSNLTQLNVTLTVVNTNNAVSSPISITFIEYSLSKLAAGTPIILSNSVSGLSHVSTYSYTNNGNDPIGSLTAVTNTSPGTETGRGVSVNGEIAGTLSNLTVAANSTATITIQTAFIVTPAPSSALMLLTGLPFLGLIAFRARRAKNELTPLMA